MFENDTQIFLRLPINKRKDGIPNIPGFSKDIIVEVEAISWRFSADGDKELYLVEKCNNEMISNELFKHTTSSLLVVEVPFGLKIEIGSKEPTFRFFIFSSKKKVYLYILQGKIRKTKMDGGEVLFVFEDPVIDAMLLSKIKELEEEINHLIKKNADLQKRTIELEEEKKRTYLSVLKYIAAEKEEETQ